MARSQRSDKPVARRRAPQAAGAPYERLHQQFGWAVPAGFNMAEACCLRWGTQPDASKKIAIIAHQPGKKPQLHSYRALFLAAQRAAGVFRSL
ncbi:MAG: hypothetical protein RLZZ401_139, partial [Pseudomonadota bacterium]